MLNFRTDGSWGPGQGADLPAKDIDLNFYTISQRAARLADVPPIPTNGIADVVVLQSEVIIYLQNGTALGPFNIPTPDFSWEGEWEASTEYSAFDVFSVEGQGIYLVLEEYTSGSEFDDGVEPVQQVFGSLGDEITVSPVYTIEEVELDLTVDVAGWYLRCLNGSTLTIPTDEQADWLDGTYFVIRQVGDDPVGLSGSTGVDILPPSGRLARTGRRGATMYAKRTATNTWDVWGDLAPTEE